VVAAFQGKGKDQTLITTFYESASCHFEQISAEATEFVHALCIHLGDATFARATWDINAHCETASRPVDVPAMSFAAQLTGTPASGIGVDVSTSVSSDDFTCMKKTGVDYVIVRAWNPIRRT